VATFERVTHAMSKITGVPFTNSTVFALYSAQQQSLPASPLISAFLPSHQTAISQMASAYCAQLMATPTLRQAFFNSSTLESNLSLGASSFFASAANRQIVESALVAHAVGSNVSLPAAQGVTAELEKLLPYAPTLQGGMTVSTDTQAACAAVLGSAVVTLQ